MIFSTHQFKKNRSFPEKFFCKFFKIHSNVYEFALWFMHFGLCLKFQFFDFPAKKARKKTSNRKKIIFSTFIKLLMKIYRGVYGCATCDMIDTLIAFYCILKFAIAEIGDSVCVHMRSWWELNEYRTINPY